MSETGKGRAARLLAKAVGSRPRSPICYVAELVGSDTDSERAIRWLIALMVLCCDPMAICPDSRGIGTAINRYLKPTFGPQHFYTRRADAIDGNSGKGQGWSSEALVPLLGAEAMSFVTTIVIASLTSRAIVWPSFGTPSVWATKVVYDRRYQKSARCSRICSKARLGFASVFNGLSF